MVTGERKRFNVIYIALAMTIVAGLNVKELPLLGEQTSVKKNYIFMFQMHLRGWKTMKALTVMKYVRLHQIKIALT